MYHTNIYHHQKPAGRRGGYFLPFLSIIIIGLIIVLVFQMVAYFQSKHKKSLENKAAVQLSAGRAEMKIWGVDQWMGALDGSILNEGDAVRTGPGSRVILSLLNGSVVRLSSETEVELMSLKSRDGQDELALDLKKGDVWLKKSSNESVRASFQVSTPNLEVASLGTTFDVENAVRQSVRVISGKVQAKIKVTDAGEDAAPSVREIETLEVALGQEISLGENDILDLKNGRPVDLLAMVSDSFRDDDWYKWNKTEDLSGNAGISVADAVSERSQQANVVENVTTPEPVEAPPVEIVAAISAPVILMPKADSRTTRSGSVLISGTTAASTDKMEVTTYIGGKEESYVLRKYTAGSVNWSYVASTSYNNLMPGENNFKIVAIGKDGKKSPAAEFTIVFDKPKEPADLSTPSISSINGAAYTGAAFETEEDVIIIIGKIGKGIAKVYVDDFMLTRYVVDSGKWSYYVKTAYGNLKEGENIFSVYGADYDGNKTPAAKFTIVKKPKATAEVPAAQPETAPASNPATPPAVPKAPEPEVEPAL